MQWKKQQKSEPGAVLVGLHDVRVRDGGGQEGLEACARINIIYIYIYMYIYIYIYTHTYLYIYIYIERERYIDRYIDRYILIFIIIIIITCLYTMFMCFAPRLPLRLPCPTFYPCALYSICEEWNSLRQRKVPAFLDPGTLATWILTRIGYRVSSDGIQSA